MTVPSIFLHELPKSELTIRDDTWSNEPGFGDSQHAAEAFESQIYRPQSEPVTPAASLPDAAEMRRRWNLTTADQLASQQFETAPLGAPREMPRLPPRNVNSLPQRPKRPLLQKIRPRRLCMAWS